MLLLPQVCLVAIISSVVVICCCRKHLYYVGFQYSKGARLANESTPTNVPIHRKLAHETHTLYTRN
jgi:hypothetical protein